MKPPHIPSIVASAQNLIAVAEQAARAEALAAEESHCRSALAKVLGVPLGFTLTKLVTGAVEEIDRLETAGAEKQATIDRLNAGMANLVTGHNTACEARDEAEKHLGYLAKFMKVDGMTWAFVVSQTINHIEGLRRMAVPRATATEVSALARENNRLCVEVTRLTAENAQLREQKRFDDEFLEREHIASWTRLRQHLPPAADGRALVERIEDVMLERNRLAELEETLRGKIKSREEVIAEYRQENTRLRYTPPPGTRATIEWTEAGPVLVRSGEAVFPHYGVAFGWREMTGVEFESRKPIDPASPHPGPTWSEKLDAADVARIEAKANLARSTPR